MECLKAAQLVIDKFVEVGLRFPDSLGTDTSGWRSTQQPPALMLSPGRQIVDGGIVMYGA